MDDRSLVTRLIEIGVNVHRRDPDAYAVPSEDSNLKSIGAATIANWLEKLGRHRLIGNVQPCFTSLGAGFRYQVTDDAIRLLSDTSRFNAWLDRLIPPTPDYDVFISYASGDSATADELRNNLEKKTNRVRHD